jgi:ribonucleoside-triphosphate reductase
MEDEPVVYGGKIVDDAYGDMQEELEMFNMAFAEVMLEGDARGRIFTFPIPTYNITKDFDWNSPVSQKIFEVTAKYGVPYFSNFVNSDMKPEDVRSMCCRLRIDNRELRKRGGGFFGANPLTGSIGVVTINLPRIGYLAKDEDRFFERLSELMDLARDSLEIKRKILERFTEKGLYPYSKYYLRFVKESYGKYWKNHFSTIGIIGMNEALLNMFGYGIATEEGLKFAIKTLKFMREKLMDYQEETDNLYNLEATPAEGASYRLARIDKRKYPDIIVANEKYLSQGAEPFYTNSTHLPVDYTGDLFEALEHQDNLQPLYTGGTVFHVYLGEKLYSWSMAATLVKKIAYGYHIPYFTLTPTFSICPTHGYISGEHKACPSCGAKCEVYSRVVGYFRPVDQWNDGKQSEFKIRRTFDKTVLLEAPAFSAS